MSAPLDPDHVAIGNRIREMRLLLDLTQAEFARRCYVSQSAVSRWESGRKMPGRRSQLQIADVLKASRQRMFRELLDDGRPERAA
jgi:transcriptional regulator with XRE-family HTH domain